MGPRPIPDTTIFDVRASLRGQRLNRMCGSLCSAHNREAFKAGEEAYLAKFGLSEAEKELVRKRDFGALIHAGLNIYFMIKLGACTGNSLYKMGAQMRGETYDQFLATRKISGAI